MWESMPGVHQTFVVSKDADDDVREGMIDKTLLEELVAEKDQPFYICGPGGLVNAMRDTLREMGVAEKNILVEDGW